MLFLRYEELEQNEAGFCTHRLMYGFWFNPDVEAPVEEKKPSTKHPKDQIANAEDNVAQAGKRMAGRMVGLMKREASRLLDQFPILDKYMTQAQIEKTIWAHFLAELNPEGQETEEVDT